MSWAAHDLEPYVIQKHLGKKVAFVPLLVGSYAPDLLSKWFVYGVGLAGVELKADDPAQFHRGWPGAGFTHSLTFGVVVGLLLYLVFGNKVVAYSFTIGQWAHALTDMGDTVGSMLFFPFTDHLFAIGAWAYAGQTGRYVDAGAYFSGLGFVWDGVFVVWAILSWRVLTRGYFRETVMAADPFWRWAGQVRLRDDARRALPGVVLLRRRALDGVADLGARRPLVRVRPTLGRPALGAEDLRRRAEHRRRAGVQVPGLLLDDAAARVLRRRSGLRVRERTDRLDPDGVARGPASAPRSQAAVAPSSRYRARTGPVAQWIERQTSNLRAEVRLLPGPCRPASANGDMPSRRAQSRFARGTTAGRSPKRPPASLHPVPQPGHKQRVLSSSRPLGPNRVYSLAVYANDGVASQVSSVGS